MSRVIQFAALLSLLFAPLVMGEPLPAQQDNRVAILKKNITITSYTQGNRIRALVTNTGSDIFPSPAGAQGTLRLTDAKRVTLVERRIGGGGDLASIPPGAKLSIIIPLPTGIRTAHLEMIYTRKPGPEGEAASVIIYEKTWRLGWWWWSPVREQR